MSDKQHSNCSHFIVILFLLWDIRKSCKIPWVKRRLYGLGLNPSSRRYCYKLLLKLSYLLFASYLFAWFIPFCLIKIAQTAFIFIKFCLIYLSLLLALQRVSNLVYAILTTSHFMQEITSSTICQYHIMYSRPHITTNEYILFIKWPYIFLLVI